MYLLRGQLDGDILSVQAVFTVGHPRNADLDLSDGYQVEHWEAFEKDGVSYIPAQYNIKTGEIIYQKGMVEPDPEPTPIEQLQAENDVLGQTIASLSLQNIQLNTMVDTLGETLAQAQLDIMTLKGGAV